MEPTNNNQHSDSGGAEPEVTPAQETHETQEVSSPPATESTASAAQSVAAAAVSHEQSSGSFERAAPTFFKLTEAPRTLLLQAPRSYVLLGALFLTLVLIGSIRGVSTLKPIETLTVSPESQAAAALLTERRNAFAGLELEASGVYVYDTAEDIELFSKNATMQLPLASITKVLLVLVAAEVLPLDAHTTISREAVERGGGGLTWGEEWVVGDLINYTLMTSSNTGAEALAEAAAPYLAVKYPEAPAGNAAVWRMNTLAQELGMRETYFINVTGLDESTTQAGALSSARDISTLFSYVLRTNRPLFSGTALEALSVHPINFPEREAHNTNNALHATPGLIMGKTGTTDLAGGNLAIAFDVTDNHPIIVVVLGSSPLGRYLDIEALVGRVQAAYADRLTQ